MSNPDLWDFLHGATVDAEPTYEEAVESEENGSDDFSLVTDQPEDADEDPHPPDEAEDM